MRLRVYINADCPGRKSYVTEITGYVHDIGEITERSSEPYWKIPNLIEELWVFVSCGALLESYNNLMLFFGTGWTQYDDEAHLTVKLAGTNFRHKGIQDIFLSIEPMDRGRELGILPKFQLDETVIFISDSGSLRDHAGKNAMIVAHSFDYENSKTWGYAIKIEGATIVYCVEEHELTAKR